MLGNAFSSDYHVGLSVFFTMSRSSISLKSKFAFFVVVERVPIA
jgi:hypothetical protein